MEVAPFRALTHIVAIVVFCNFIFVEMEVAPFRALTQEFFKLGSSNLNL